jgi:hypothetical protein
MFVMPQIRSLPQGLPQFSRISRPLPQKNRVFSAATATATISPQTTATTLPQRLPLPQFPLKPLPQTQTIAKALLKSQ